jgi:hypothetical protein
LETAHTDGDNANVPAISSASLSSDCHTDSVNEPGEQRAEGEGFEGFEGFDTL